MLRLKVEGIVSEDVGAGVVCLIWKGYRWSWFIGRLGRGSLVEVIWKKRESLSDNRFVS